MDWRNSGCPKRGQDAILLQEGLSSISSNMKNKSLEEVVVIEATQPKQPPHSFTHAHETLPPQDVGTQTGISLGGAGETTSSLWNVTPSGTHRSWCNLCTPRDDIDQARRLPLARRFGSIDCRATLGRGVLIRPASRTRPAATSGHLQGEMLPCCCFVYHPGRP